ncbi:MAG: DUF2306 domain-containing protein [Chloroflexi bacterium]|nr:DUF2306 domain-containing protein [Chloroflexota bacterium]
MRKGTRWHRTLGHIYLTTMIGLNITGLSIFNLFGHFGPFHWLAMISLIMLIVGMVPVFTRRPKGRWLEWHAGFINGSFVGLVAATASEITSRIPGTEDNFGLVVGLTSVLIVGIGSMLIQGTIQKSRKHIPARFQHDAKMSR